MSRKARLKTMAPKGHPTGPIGRKGSYHRRQLGAATTGGSSGRLSWASAS